MLEISTLGGLTIKYDNTPITNLASRKAEALLVYLACTEQAQPREVLADLLWDDRPLDRALSNLRVLLTSLRRELGAYLSVDRQTVAFNAENLYWLDTAVLERGLAWVREQRLAADGLSGEAVGHLAQILDLYQGDFLYGLYLRHCQGFEEWQIMEGERLRLLVIEALDDLVAAYLALGQTSAGIEQARRLLQLDPLREEAHRQMMALLLYNGQRNAALTQYEMCRQILADELGVEPTPETTELYQQIRAGNPVKPAIGTTGTVIRESKVHFGLPGEVYSGLPDDVYPGLPDDRTATPRHNLPIQLTPFVGREAELAELAQILTDPAMRLVTILGPGGMGKTRLAVEVAKAQLDQFSQGIYFVSLAPLQSADSIVPTIAEALNFSFHEGSLPQQQLLNYLHQKSALLVMDNFEHVLAGAGFVVEMLKVAPNLKILVTSRAKLDVQAEQLYHLAGIDIPQQITASHEGAAHAGAVKLFLQRAQRVRPDFELTIDNVTDVVRICRLLEGMPLGILLAAVWIELLSPREIAAEINRSLDFLKTDASDIPGRQRSIRAVFDHSWRLLTEQERAVFQQLSVFRGGFSRQAAEAVTGASLRELMSLVNKSLLHRLPTGRYELHELLRQYTAERLAEGVPEKAEVQQKHSAYYFEFLKQRQTTLQDYKPDKSVLTVIEVEIENIRVAWQWLLAQGEIKAITVVADCLWFFYKRKALYQEAVSIFKQACSLKAASAHQKGHWQRLLAEAHRGLGQPVESRTHLQCALAHLGQPMPTTAGAMAVGLLEQVLRQIGRWIWPAWLRLPLPLRRQSPEASASLLEAARSYNGLAQMYYIANEAIPLMYTIFRELNLAERAGVSPELARAYADAGALFNFFRFHNRAQLYFHRAQETAQELDDSSALAWVLLGSVFSDIGYRPWAEIQNNFEQAIALYKHLEDKRGWGDSLTWLSFILCWQGQFAQGVDIGIEVHTIGVESDNLEHQAWGLNVQAMNLLRLGQTDQAVALYETAQSLLTLITQSRVAEILNYGGVAVARLRQGQRQAAQQAAETATRLISQSLPIASSLFDGYVGLAEVYLTLWEDAIFSGEPVEATPLKMAAKNACQAIRKFAWWLPIGQPRAWLSWGLYCWLAGKHRKAYRAWQKSLACAQRLDMPYEEGLVHYEIGRHLPVEDSRRHLHLGQAVEIFDRLGAAYDLACAEAALYGESGNVRCAS